MILPFSFFSLTVFQGCIDVTDVGPQARIGAVGLFFSIFKCQFQMKGLSLHIL